MSRIKHIDWPAWIGTLLLIIVFREASVWIMTQFNHPELGNLVGLLSLLAVLFTWRKLSKIPARLVRYQQQNHERKCLCLFTH